MPTAGGRRAEVRGGRPRPQARITAITQAGDAATATVLEQGFWGTLSFFALARIDGRWPIVDKTFAHTGGELAPEE